MVWVYAVERMNVSYNLREMKISLKEAKSILKPSKLPGSDYIVNPYLGCAFGCVYCYADFTRRFTDHIDDIWGEYVNIKINTPEIFEKELNSLSKKLTKGIV